MAGRGGAAYADLVVSDERVEDVEAVLVRLIAWAQRHADVRALALVGSWASGVPHARSDVDVVLLTQTPSKYIDHDHWIAEVGGALVRTATWGAITERRLAVSGGLELDVAVGIPDWASVTPLDSGTRRVVTDGMRRLHDPDGLLILLDETCQALTSGPAPPGPTQTSQ
jgi:hypothetical protein